MSVFEDEGACGVLKRVRVGAVGWLLVSAAVASACAAGASAGAEGAGVETLFSESRPAMGTTFELHLYAADRARADALFEAAFEEIERVEAVFSNYRPTSELSRINRQAAGAPVVTDPEVFGLLERAFSFSRMSGGAFDMTVGKLMKAWGFYKGEGNLPRPAEVSTALDRVGYRFVRLDRAARTVRFTRSGVEIDPGGIGKGYAVDRVVEVLKSRGVDAALVSAAGSSIYGMGAPPDDPRGWPITISTPRRLDETAAQVVLKNRSLSTSGSYEKFFWAEGRTYAHIMDPRTGYPASGVASVSVLASRTIDSEAWTKPFFINGRAWTAAHKPKDQRVFFCETGTPGSCKWLP